MTIKAFRPLFIVLLSTPMALVATSAYADSGSGPTSISRLFESKDNYTGAAATKIKEFKDAGDISSLDFSPDGKYLVASDPGNIEVHIWDWQGKSHIARKLYEPQGTGLVTTANGVRYSVDGHLIAALHGRAAPEDGYSVIRIWDTSSGKIVHDIDESISSGFSGGIAFSPDDSVFMRSSDRLAIFPGDQLIVHNTATWTPIWGLRTVPFYPRTLALSPNGKLIALGGSESGPDVVPRCLLIIVSLELRKVIRTIDAFPLTQVVERIAWDPDNVHIAAGVKVTGSFPGPDAVRVFDATTGQQVAAEPTASARINGLVYTPDGKYLIETEIEKKTRVWDGQHKNLLQEIPANLPAGYTVGALAVSRDSRYLAIASLSEISIWKLH